MNRLSIVLTTAAMMALAGPALARDRGADTRHDPYGGYRGDARVQRQTTEYRRTTEPRQAEYQPRRLRAEPLIGTPPEYRNALRAQRPADSQPTDLLRSLDRERHGSATEGLRSRRQVVIDQPRPVATGDTGGARVYRNPIYSTDRASTLDARLDRGTTIVGSSDHGPQSPAMLRGEPIGRTISPRQIEVARYNWDSRWDDSRRRHHWDRDRDRFDARFRYTTRHYGVYGSPIHRYPSRVHYRYDSWPSYCYPSPVIVYPRHHYHHHDRWHSSVGLSFHFRFD